MSRTAFPRALMATAVLFGLVSTGFASIALVKAPHSFPSHQAVMAKSHAANRSATARSDHVALLIANCRAPRRVLYMTADGGLGAFYNIAVAGVGNGIAQFWWTRSLSLAPPSAVVPFNYLSLVWAIILGFAVWGDVPTPGLLVGSAIVVASGLYILWRETLRRRRPAVPAPQRG